MLLHCFILYVPWAALLFSVDPLDREEWVAVLIFSFPVILIDELLKAVTRSPPPPPPPPFHPDTIIHLPTCSAVSGDGQWVVTDRCQLSIASHSHGGGAESSISF